MRITNVRLAGAVLGLFFVTACRSNSTNSPNPDGAVGTPDTPDGRIHIQDVQSDAMAVGTAVELHGVIVTAFDTFGAKTRSDMWVEEPGGGPFSGVHVFFNPPLADTVAIAVGDIVDITGGAKNEFAINDPTPRKVTEVQGATKGSLVITKTGTGTVPAPFVLDVAALEAMPQAARDTEYEKWEGVLIQVKNVRTRSYPQGFGSTRPIPDDSFKVAVTDSLLVESTQTKFTGIDGLTCFASITGVEDYFFDWLLLPRTPADLATGTGCAALPITTTTITDIQAATPTGAVELDGVYVTGVSNTKTSFWISTTATPVKNQGGYVFQSSSTLPLDPAIVPGAKVNVIGTVSEFNDDTMGGTLTEVAPLRITVVDPTAATLTPNKDLAVVDLLVPANAQAYESVLITLDNVNITAVGNAANGFVATAVQNGTTFKIGTDVIQLAAADYACYKTVTGFWTNLEAAGTTATTKPNAFGFIVRDLGTKDGTCN